MVQLSPLVTSVVYEGTLLNPTHLKLGELVRVRSTVQEGRAVARTIEVVKRKFESA